MELRLYKNISEQNKINKTLKNELVLTGTLRETTSIIKPSITIEISNPTVYNYVYIPQFKRYYYINNIISQRNNIWTLELNVDVLMSYQSGILSLKANVARQENDFNEWYADEKILTTSKRRVHIYDCGTTPFSTTGGGRPVVLTVSGGVS